MTMRVLLLAALTAAGVLTACSDETKDKSKEAAASAAKDVKETAAAATDKAKEVASEAADKAAAVGEYYDVFTLAGAMLGTKFGIYCISPRNVYTLTEIGKIFQLVDKLEHRTIDMLIKYEIKKKQDSKTDTEQNEKSIKEV